MRQNLNLFIQFAIAATLGCIAYVCLMDDPNPKVALFGALFAGIGGQWLVLFCWNWGRHGWKAARSMRMDGS